MARTVRGEGRLDIALTLLCIALAVVAFVLPQRTREELAKAMRATVLSPLVAIEARSAAVRAAVAARGDLLMTRGRAVTDTLSLRALSDENATLRRTLGLSARLRDGFVPAELLPSRGGDPFTMHLPVGSVVGVQPFLPVVSADGLVGMVESVDPVSSSIITWAHPDFRVSAMSVDQAAFGIVQPHLAAGAERWLLELRGVPYRAKLDTGTLIVSSGLGATYPRGIPVGTVIGELATPEKWSRTYLVKPVVLAENLGPVLVLLPGRAQRGLEGVWTSAAAADSAAQAVVLAGDSLQRAAAFNELAARRAALDSLLADSLAFAGIRDSAVVRDTASRRDRGSADSVRRGSVRTDSARMRPPGGMR